MALEAHKDYDLGIVAYRPDGDVIGSLPHPMEIQVAYPLNEVPAVTFSYAKDSAAARWFLRREAIEVAVVHWVPGRDQWVEPPMSRFVVLQWEDDVTDETNIIRFTAPGYSWLLSKQLIRKGKNDDALNAAEAKAAKAYEDAKNKAGGSSGSMSGALSTVKSIMKYKGGTYALSYFPKTVKSGTKQVKPANKSILYHTGRNKLYWYKSATSAWYIITTKDANAQLTNLRNAYTKSSSDTAAEAATKKAYDKAKNNAKEATKDGKRPMLKTTAGWAMKRHWDETKGYGRGRLGGASRTFNGTYGSGRNAAGLLHRKWKDRVDIDLTIGMSLLDLLTELTNMGLCEWRTRGRALDMFRPGDFASDLSGKVALHMGVDLTEAPDKATRHNFANYLLVRGEKNLSFGMTNPGADSSGGWGTMEKAVSVSGASTVATAKKLALKEAKDSLKRIKIESTRGLIVHEGGHRPMYDYLPGDWIRVYGVDGTLQKVRIMQITLTREAGGHISGNLVLADRFYAQALDFRNSLASTLGGYETTIGGGTVPMLPQTPVGGVSPSARGAVSSLAIAARSGINEASGANEVILSIDWAPPGKDAFTPMAANEEPNDTDTDPEESVPDY